MELNAEEMKGKTLIKGHFEKELHGLSVHPSLQQFVTAGEDNLLIVWDARRRVATKQIQLTDSSHCVAYNNDGTHLVVGLKTGQICVYDIETSRQITYFQHSSKEILIAKYSPKINNTEYLAIGSHDAKIYIYTVNESKYGKKCICRGHNGPITHLDFSDDGKLLQSNSKSNELFYWNVESGSQIMNPTTMRNIQWSTWSCPFGWSVQGLWPKTLEDKYINAVCRNSLENSIVACDNIGRVLLYRYPCPNLNGGSQVYLGHSSKVTNIMFTFGN